MALQTLEGDLIPMRPAKETLTRYAVLLLGAAILSFGLFNVHSQSGVTEGGVLGTTLLLHHWFGISPGVSEFVIDVICYALGFRFLGKAFFKYAIAASAGFACFYMLWERVGPVLPDLSGQPLIAALLGGVFVGVGVGLVVRAGGASGGDDVKSFYALWSEKRPSLSLSIHEDELDRIDEAAADLYGAAQSGDFETYCAARERLMAFLPTLADGEKPSFRRVF